MSDGVLSVVVSGNESEWEWKINNFSHSVRCYMSPTFKFECEYWWLHLLPNGANGYMHVRLWRSSCGSPIEVEFSVFIKTTKGTKNFERRERWCFEGRRYYDIIQWISRSEFSHRQREFLSSGCLTLLITMMKADSVESESASAAAVSSDSKDIHQGDKISFDRKFLNKLAKCAQCDEVVSLNNWFDHECQISNAKAARSEAICSFCKERLHEDKITLHKKCLNKETKCPTCDEVVNLQNWFDHVCQMENVPTASVAAACSCCKESIHGDKVSFHKDCLNKETKCPKCDEIVSLPNWFDHVCEMANVRGESGVSQQSVSQPKAKTLQDLKNLFFNQENCDLVLRVQGQEFSAHQAILTARSPVFASTFRSNMKEKETGTVDIEDIHSSCFPEFLCFLYCGEIDKLSAENVYSLFIAAEKYEVPDLRTMCIQFMKENLTLDAFCETLVLALLHTETQLLDSCTAYFLQNAEEIIKSAQWQNFVAENPTQGNELFLKYVQSFKKSNK